MLTDARAATLKIAGPQSRFEDAHHDHHTTDR
jgi:hypothetical protein